MGIAPILLLVLAGLWVLQIIGTYFQMQHYRKVLGGITGESNEGYVGVGNAKARLGKGVVLILVTDGEGRVRKALKMRGMTVFARFKEAPEMVGLSLDELRGEGREESKKEKGMVLAARRAVEQIDRMKAEKEEAAVAG